MNPLPKKLEDALKAQSRYKPLAEPSPESKLTALLHERSGSSTSAAVAHSYEQGLLESILGASNRKPSSASGSRSRGSSAKSGGDSSGGLFPSRSGNSGRVLADSISNRPADPLLWPPRSPRKNDPSSCQRASATTRDQAAGSPSPLRNVTASSGISPRSSDHGVGSSSRRQRNANGHTTSTRNGSSHRDRTRHDESAKWSPPETSSSKEEKDLLASMASRLSQLEKASRSLRADLVAKDKQVLHLQRENALLERAVGRSPNPLSASSFGYDDESEAASSKLCLDPKAVMEENFRLEATNRKLQTRVLEMETFLSDYGLVWRGSDEVDGEGGGDEYEATSSGDVHAGAASREGGAATISNQLIPGEAAAVTAMAAKRPHFDLFVAKAESLNGLLDQTSAKLVVNGKQAKYEFGTDSIKCTIYSDGMSLRNGDFRPWHASNAQSFVKDVVDGFFPSEFREMYPDGVRIDVIDKRTVTYVDPSVFAGAGHTLGQKAVPLSQLGGLNFTRLTPRGSPRLTPRTTPRDGASPLQRDDSEGGKGLAEIIKGLPDKRVVTSSGEIVDVKGELKRCLASSKPSNQQQARASAAVAAKREAIATAAAARAEQEESNVHDKGWKSNDAGTCIGSVEKGGLETNYVLTSAAARPPKAELHDSPSNPSEAAATTTLRVRVGSKTRLEFTLPAFSTLRELYGRVARSADLSVESFELRGSFPARAFLLSSDSNTALEALGLTPSAALILHKLKAPNQ